MGKLDYETFIMVPKGFEDQGKIARLNSEIYGLSQASRVFYNTVKKFLVMELKFLVCRSDGFILFKSDIILGLYVDDILIVGEYDKVNWFIEEFGKNFR